MGLFPSNASVPGFPDEDKCFPNCAGSKDIDDELAKELEDAGIVVERYELFRDGKSEVDTAVVGTLKNWFFKRAWYYWVAKGRGIPPLYADKLHETHGQVVRVDGNCGCPSPLEYCNGFAVGLYHVDSPAGLKALAGTIKQVAADAELRLADYKKIESNIKEMRDEKAVR